MPTKSILCSSLIVMTLFGPSCAAGGDFFGRVSVEGRIYFANLKSSSSDRYFRAEPFPPAREVADREFPLDEAEILVPVVSTKVFGAANNYKGPDYDPAKKPANPELFFKAPSSLLAQGGTIVLPKDLESAVYEGEMVAVIGKRAKNVSIEEAPEYVFGVTCGNDVSGTGWPNDFQLWRSKAADTFAPCGPFIATGLDYNDLALELRVNGEVRQKSRTGEMIFSVAELVSFISHYLTLEPGDLIYTGTPGPLEKVNPGDVVEVEIEGAGVLRNTVAREK
jgi:2-keto-4-pentenoate hydratase/2-oxohepta-3-ene-1,7-dioic acid hydratase in catechol pathway